MHRARRYHPWGRVASASRRLLVPSRSEEDVAPRWRCREVPEIYVGRGSSTRDRALSCESRGRDGQRGASRGPWSLSRLGHLLVVDGGRATSNVHLANADRLRRSPRRDGALELAAGLQYVGEPVSIREVLLPALLLRFPDRPFRAGSPPAAVVIYPCCHPDVGDLEIFDDGDEATIVLGRHTHSHFNPYDASVTETELASMVTQSVIEFLDDLFADRVLIWSIEGHSGGWTSLPESSSGVPAAARAFRWSGPIDLASTPCE